jgi:hypothetical protein
MVVAGRRALPLAPLAADGVVGPSAIRHLLRKTGFKVHIGMAVVHCDMIWINFMKHV